MISLKSFICLLVIKNFLSSDIYTSILALFPILTDMLVCFIHSKVKSFVVMYMPYIIFQAFNLFILSICLYLFIPSLSKCFISFCCGKFYQHFFKQQYKYCKTHENLIYMTEVYFSLVFTIVSLAPRRVYGKQEEFNKICLIKASTRFFLLILSH